MGAAGLVRVGHRGGRARPGAAPPTLLPGRKPGTGRDGAAARGPGRRGRPGDAVMRIAAVVLLLLFAAAVPAAAGRWLPRAAWPSRAPRAGIAVWLAGPLSAVACLALAGLILAVPCAQVGAQLKTWRILRKLRCCPWRAGQLAKAIHALEIHAA